jgi:hypothetical protein
MARNTGRMNLLEEVGRIDAERMNPNRRAEKRRVIGELDRGYKGGGIAKRGKGIAYKKGGHVKSMGKAKRGGGIAKK